MNIIETQNLTKNYGDFTAVSHLNLHIRKGSVYGFLGPNGAGKSTTMKMFLGLTQPTEGSFHIDGKTYPSDRVPILTTDLADRLDAYDFDPAELDQIESRLDTIYRIKQKFGMEVEELLAYRDKVAEELVNFQSSGKRIAELRTQMQEIGRAHV